MELLSGNQNTRNKYFGVILHHKTTASIIYTWILYEFQIDIYTNKRALTHHAHTHLYLLFLDQEDLTLFFP